MRKRCFLWALALVMAGHMMAQEGLNVCLQANLDQLVPTWKKLAKRKDLTMKEYFRYCYGEVDGTRIVVYDEDGREDMVFVLYVPPGIFTGFSYLSHLFPYEELCRLNRDIIGRLEKPKSYQYLIAANGYYNALMDKWYLNKQNSQLEKEAYNCCVDALRSGAVSPNEDKYYTFAFKGVQCLMSLDKSAKKVNSWLTQLQDQAATAGLKEAQMTALILHAQQALLQKDHKKAVELQLQAMKIYKQQREWTWSKDMKEKMLSGMIYVGVLTKNDQILEEVSVYISNWDVFEWEGATPRAIGEWLYIFAIPDDTFGYRIKLNQLLRDQLYQDYDYSPTQYYDDDITE